MRKHLVGHCEKHPVRLEILVQNLFDERELKFKDYVEMFRCNEYCLPDITLMLLSDLYKSPILLIRSDQLLVREKIKPQNCRIVVLQNSVGNYLGTQVKQPVHVGEVPDWLTSKPDVTLVEPSTPVHVTKENSDNTSKFTIQNLSPIKEADNQEERKLPIQETKLDKKDIPFTQTVSPDVNSSSATTEVISKSGIYSNITEVHSSTATTEVISKSGLDSNATEVHDGETTEDPDNTLTFSEEQGTEAEGLPKDSDGVVPAEGGSEEIQGPLNSDGILESDNGGAIGSPISSDSSQPIIPDTVNMNYGPQLKARPLRAQKCLGATSPVSAIKTPLLKLRDIKKEKKVKEETTDITSSDDSKNQKQDQSKEEIRYGCNKCTKTFFTMSGYNHHLLTGHRIKKTKNYPPTIIRQKDTDEELAPPSDDNIEL